MPPRMTIPTQRVLAALLDEPERELYAMEIGERAELRSGTVHPILARLEGIGWLASGWEGVDPPAGGRPARPYHPPPAATTGSRRTASSPPGRRSSGPGVPRPPAGHGRRWGRRERPDGGARPGG